ncbi:MAG: glutathione S-transferase family protein [Oceanicola sp.]|nr:glutathione S-transferase family protein [Oceanicola sp.]
MMRLHHCPGTRSVRVLWLLHEMDLPFELVEHAFGANLHAPEYRAIHPAGRVPALEVEGQIMLESGAILEWLCEQHPEKGLAPQPGTGERAAFLQWLHFAETLSQHSAALTQQHVALYEDWMRSPIVTKIEAKRLARCFATLEEALQGRVTLLESGFSAADIAVGQAVDMSRHFVSLEPYPALSAWMDALQARPAYGKAMPDGATVLYDRAFYPPLPVVRPEEGA